MAASVAVFASGAALAADRPPAAHDAVGVAKINALSQLALAHFYAGEFTEERSVRMSLIDELVENRPGDHRVSYQRAFLKSVDAILRLPEEQQREVVDARRRFAAAERTYQRSRDVGVLVDYEIALSTYRRLLGSDDAVTAEITWRTGAVLFQAKRREEARDLLVEARDSIATTQGEENTFGVLNTLGMVYIELGESDEAARSLERALELVTIADGQMSPRRAGVLFNLALAYNRAGLYSKAEAAANGAEAYFVTQGPAAKGWRARCLLERASSLAGQGYNAEARQVFEQAFGEAEALAPRDPSGIYGRLTEARAKYNEILAAEAKVRPGD